MKFSDEKFVISKFNIWDGLSAGERIKISIVYAKYSIWCKLWQYDIIDKLFFSSKEYEDWQCQVASSNEHGLAKWYLENFKQDISEKDLIGLIGKKIYIHYDPAEILGHKLDPDTDTIKVIGYKKDVRVCSDVSLAYRYSLSSSCEYDNDILVGTIFEVVNDTGIIN